MTATELRLQKLDHDIQYLQRLYQAAYYAGDTCEVNRVRRLLIPLLKEKESLCIQ